MISCIMEDKKWIRSDARYSSTVFFSTKNDAIVPEISPIDLDWINCRSSVIDKAHVRDLYFITRLTGIVSVGDEESRTQYHARYIRCKTTSMYNAGTKQPPNRHPLQQPIKSAQRNHMSP
jgi:hypothetical protein